MAETNFSSLLKCIIIGINEYDDTGLTTLQSPEKDCARLAVALVNPAACGVPGANLLVLTQTACGTRVTKDLLLEKLPIFLTTITENDTLLVYFAGHGEKDEKGFYLCLSDTLISDLAASSWSGTSIESLFSKLRLKGLFFIIDCCKSAGFAEYAPAIFTKSFGSAFKILLSSARDNELSWELPEGGGTLFSNHLINVVSGEVDPGDGSGLVFFTALFEHLQSSVAEDLETLYPSLGKQEPVFAGTYARNPVIFTNRKLTVAQVAQKVSRYSREYVRRKIKRMVLGILVAAVFLGGASYTVLDNYQYAAVNKEGILEIYKGYPGVNVFGFPKWLWTTSFPVTAVRPGSPLRNNQPVVSGLGNPVLLQFENELNPVYRSLVDIYQHDTTAAAGRLIAFINHNLAVDAAQNDLNLALLLLPDVLYRPDNSLLEKMITLPRVEAKSVAARFFGRGDTTGISDAENWLLQQPATIIVEYLNELQKKKLPAANAARLAGKIITSQKLMSEQPSAVAGKILLYCATHGIVLPDSSLLHLVFKINDTGQLPDVATYIRLSGRASAITDSLVRKVKIYATRLKDYNNFSAINHSLQVLSRIATTACNKEYYTIFNNRLDYFKPDAASAIIANCPGAFLPLNNSGVEAEVARFGRLPEDSLLLHLQAATEDEALIHLVDAARYINTGKVNSVLVRLTRHPNSVVATMSIDLLRERNFPFKAPLPLLAGNEGETISAALKWLYQVNPCLAMEIIFQRFNDPKIYQETLAEIFSQHTLLPVQRKLLEDRLTGEQNERDRAAMAFGICGTREEALRMLTDKDEYIRSAASRYIMLRNDLPALDSLVRSHSTFPDYTSVVLAEAISKKEQLMRDAAKMPAMFADWYWDMIFSDNKNNHAAQIFAGHQHK